MADFKIGDFVTVRDCSYAVQVNRFNKDGGIIHGGKYVVVGYPPYGSRLTSANGSKVHDIFLKSERGEVFLHSAAFVVKNHEVEELTLEQVCKELGREIKIIK